MRRNLLGQTGIEVSEIGYGCTQLTSASGRKQSIHLLETAFAEGITHFDVARCYGFGRAEAILSEFLRGKRQSVTVATKFGINPPSGVAGNRALIDLAKRILRPFPRLLQRARNRGAMLVTPGKFSADAAIESLEISLRELKTDYVDIFFLHEATPVDASDHDLIGALEKQIEKGKVRALGIASAFSILGNNASLLPTPIKLIQVDDDVVTCNLAKLANREKRSLLIHSVFKHYGILLEWISSSTGLVSRYSEKIELNLADPRTLGLLLLEYSRSLDCDVVLFSSSSPARIKANIRYGMSAAYDASQLAIFGAFVRDLTSQQTPRIRQAHQPS